MTKILIVDDSEATRTRLRETFKRQGAEVFEAENGVEGLKSFQTYRPDVLIVDLVMPAEDGEQLLMNLRRVAPKAKVIALSGIGRGDSPKKLYLEVLARWPFPLENPRS